MTTPTTTLIDTTVLAEDAPVGVLLWPVVAPRHAPNFTLESVEIVRNSRGRHVIWVYESGTKRYFNYNESVAIRIERLGCPDIDAGSFCSHWPQHV